MELFKSQYWKYTVMLQKLIGLYYFQSLWKNIVSWTWAYAFTWSIMIAVGVRLVEELNVNIDIVIENMLGEMYCIVILIKLTASIAYKKDLKDLYERIANDWKVINDENELKVLHAYTAEGSKSIQWYSGYLFISAVTFLGMPIIAPVWDYIAPLRNGTRIKTYPYAAEYGIDEEKYYWPLMAQIILGVTIISTVTITFDHGFILTVQHVIGLFALVCYRVDKTAEMSLKIEKGKINFYKGNRFACEYTVSAIDLHQTVLGYVDLIEHCYSISWLFVLFLNMIMCGSGMAVILMKDRPEEIIRYVTVIFAIFVHFYYIFLPGQEIINSSLEVFDKCYACNWYNLSGRNKNLIKFLMLRSLRRCELTGGKMFVMCMDTYSNMMKTGFSIFTVLR